MASLWRPPVLERAGWRHAPLLLPNGRSLLHLVARGRGWLRVVVIGGVSGGAGGKRVVWSRFCGDGFDDVVLVDVAPGLRVEFRSLVGRVALDVPVAVVLPSSPAPPPPPRLDRQRFQGQAHVDIPDLRPPGLAPIDFLALLSSRSEAGDP